MPAREMKLITCILPRGQARPVVEALWAEHQVTTANISHARGTGKLTPLRYRGVGEQTEKDILGVVVEPEAADELFEFIYEKAGINRPHGGLMFQCSLGRATPFLLPDFPEEN